MRLASDQRPGPLARAEGTPSYNCPYSPGPARAQRRRSRRWLLEANARNPSVLRSKICRRWTIPGGPRCKNDRPQLPYQHFMFPFMSQSDWLSESFTSRAQARSSRPQCRDRTESTTELRVFSAHRAVPHKISRNKTSCLAERRSSFTARMAESTEADRLEPEAFRTLFPEQYLQRFLAANTRPDGRPLMRVRPTRCARARASALLADCCLEARPPPHRSPRDFTPGGGVRIIDFVLLRDESASLLLERAGSRHSLQLRRRPSLCMCRATRCKRR